jgi:hypothetical protein
MKLFGLLLICLTALTGLGQDRPADETPPEIKILKYRWQKMGPGPSVDPAMKAESDSPGGDSSDQSDSASFVERPGFLYTVELRNEGDKSIKAVRWDYIIIDSKTHVELGRHEFENFETVGRKKTKALTAKSRLSPTPVVRIQTAGADKTMVERVVIKCVVYDDGTLWQKRGLTESVCDALRRRAQK